MENKNIYSAIGMLAIIALAIAGLMGIKKNPEPTKITDDQQATTTTVTSTGDPELDKLIQEGRVKVTVGTSGVSNTLPTRKAPSLDYVLKISPDLAPNAVTALNTQMTGLKATLQQNPTSFDSWLRVGVLAKIAGDYPRAIEVWSYAGYLASKSVAPFANMADVYANNLKDFAKAEANYKIAIANDPTSPNYYGELARLYMYSYTTKRSSAEEILTSGIRAATDNAGLKTLLEEYYKR